MIRVEALNKAIIDQAKKCVFGVVSRYLRQVEQPSINELLVLFCKLTPLYYPDINMLSFNFLERLEALMKEQTILPFQSYEHFIIIKSLSKKGFLSYADKRIFEIILEDLENRSKKLDSQVTIQLAKALIDLNL